jgi:hypothetical protein
MMTSGQSQNEPLDSINERARVGNLSAQEREIQAKLTSDNGGFFGMSDDQKARLRLRSFDLQQGINASNNYGSMPPIFSDDERAQWEEIDRERRRGTSTMLAA